MKVVCIDNGKTEPNVVQLIKGNIYTVIDSRDIQNYRTKSGYKTEDGLYYQLIETGHWYHHSLFVPINENQKDEIDIVQEREQCIDVLCNNTND